MMEPARPLAISAIEHHVYCPRQCALIHLDGVWDDNAHTVRGSHGHRRVDSAPGRLERGRRVLRGVPLWSERWNLMGKADAVEIDSDSGVVPVEYKIGTRHGLAAHLQLCAQAFCLEEMTGRRVDIGFVWFAGPRRRERVLVDDELRTRTAAAIADIKAVLAAGVLPTAVNDSRCAECQLHDHCLPELTSADGNARATAYLRQEVVACAF